MLVLTRKPDQHIQIGDNIRITIVRVKGQSVRIGIEAPKSIPVMRTELMTDEPISRHAAETQTETVEVSVQAEQTAAGKATAVSATASEATPEQRRSPFLPKAGRTPGASSASLIRRSQRLGPAALRSMAGRS